MNPPGRLSLPGLRFHSSNDWKISVPAFSDVSDFLTEVNGEPLVLPLRGRQFRFAGSPSIAEALEIKEIQRKMAAQVRGEIPADAVVIPQEEEFYDRLLGDQLALMTEAGCTDAEKNHVAVTVFVYYLQGAESAELHWTGTSARKAREAAEQGEAKPTGTTKTATPKAKKPSTGGPRSNGSGRSSKRTSTSITGSA